MDAIVVGVIAPNGQQTALRVFCAGNEANIMKDGKTMVVHAEKCFKNFLRDQKLNEDELEDAIMQERYECKDGDVVFMTNTKVSQ